MDLNKLKTFCCVAKLESITKAAWHLGRTQSAITQQIQLLEEELGLVLLERRNARVYLTPEGQRLHEFARVRIQDIEDEAARMKKESADLEGVIRLSVVDEVYGFILPDLIDGFSRQHPNIMFEINTTNYTGVEEDLIENRADFGLMVIYQDRKMFDIHPYFAFDAICAASPAYLKKHGAVKNFDDLLSHRIIDAHQHVPGVRYWIKKNVPELLSSFASQQAFISIRGAVIQKDLILRGRGIGLLALPTVEQELKDGSLVEVLPGKAKPLNVVIDVARRKKTSTHLIHEKFLDFVKANVKL